MQWTDTAILLSTRKHGETSAVVHLLTQNHGLNAGVIRGASSKTNRGILQPGNIVTATWNARLADQLGTLKCELLSTHAAHIMHDAARLSALTSACTLIEQSLPERHPYPQLYKSLNNFLNLLTLPLSRIAGEGQGGGLTNWPQAYVQLELEILSESGFGLDLTECAATGKTENLIYVSPKSGRAVSAEAGEPYKHKLLPLPQFLLPHKLSSPSPLRGEGRDGGAADNQLITHARELRKNQTEAEKILWSCLSRKSLENYRFRRQHPMGEKYIVDFICLEKKIIIELDGGQHASQQSYDEQRTAFLESEGYTVLRFWNNEIMENLEAVYQTIATSLISPPPNPPPSRGRAYTKTPSHPHTPKTPSPMTEESWGGVETPSAQNSFSPSPLRGEGRDGGETPSTKNTHEILAGLRLTSYFLENWLLTPNNRKLPAARARLLQLLEKN